MKSLGIMTTMLSENDSPIHEQHIISFYMMCQELIREMVPELVKQELERTYLDLIVKLRLILEGKEMSFPDVKDYIMSEIEKEFKKLIK